MDAMLEETLPVDVFQMQFVDISRVETDKLHALSIGVGWPHRAEDWDYLREIGQGLVGLDEIGRIIGSVMWFPHGDDFLTIGMLITSPRLQVRGAAKSLTEKVLSQHSGRRVRLNATRAAKRLYRTLGFVQRKTVYQCQGEATVSPEDRHAPAGDVLRMLDAGDFEALVALDAPGFAAVRRKHLVKLNETSVGYGLFRDGQLRAYSMCRRFGRGHLVGPVVACDDDDAIAVVRPHVEAHAGRFLRMDTHFRTGAFADYVQRSGMSVFDTVTTMTLGEDCDYGSGTDGVPMIFALASQSIG